MRSLLASIAAIVLVSTGCSSSTSSDSSAVSADYQELLRKATVVSDSADMATCSESTTNSLYFVRSSHSFKTCVDQGGALGHNYVDVNTAQTPYDSSETVLNFYSFNSLPDCGWWRRGLVVFVESSSQLKYCGTQDGYFWWYTWKDVDLAAPATGCTVATAGNGDKTITCGNSSTVIADGKDGADGQDGAKGPRGDDGTDGAPGPKGDTGPVGPQGPAGEQGPAGAPGGSAPPGPAGPAGPTGPQGPNGQPGPAGPQGPSGPAGSDGAQGPVGPQGPQGGKGPTGEVGPQGEKGETGAAGTDGADGVDGTNGTNGQSCELIPKGNNVYDIKCPDKTVTITIPPPSS